jgi:hypothetical protein
MGTKTTAEKRDGSRAQYENVRFRIPPFQLRLTEGEDGVHVPKKVQLFRVGTYEKWDEKSKKWVRFSITRETLSEFVENWKKRVRGIDLAIDFAHRSDDEAAGWFTNVFTDANGDELWADVDWTHDGRAAVAGKKFRYVSPDFAFAWRDNETGEHYGPTLFGAGLTNRPVIKNMAPTVELTEVNDMAKTKKTAPKKISELSREELELRLAEETDEEKKDLFQLRLDEMSDADTDDDGDPSAEGEGEGEGEEKKKPAKKKGADEMTFDELKAAYAKQCDEMAEMTKKMSATMSEIEKSRAQALAAKKEADFQVLLTEGKAVPAQKEAWMKGDMEAFVKLSEPVKFTTVGGHGGKAATEKETASDKILKLAEEKIKAGTKRTEATSLVLSENPELRKAYEAEMEASTADE